MKKIIIIIIFGILVIAPFFAFGLNDLLTLQGIQAHLGEFYTRRDQSPLIVGGIFFVAYVLITGFSLPGAAIMTLLAGALFGLFWGTLLASFASSIGALLAFLASRFMLRDALEKRFGEKLKAVNQGIERDGAFYLFALRLMPLFPFFLVNILMGLSPIKARTYYWVSQIGMFLGTLVYVNGGTQISQIKNLRDIVSPSLLGSFVLLAVFPLVAKRILDYTNRRRIYKTWQKPKTFDRNLVVIGAGAAGLVTSYIAAVLRAKVTLVEAHKMGGDCLNYGCIPSKALI
ncbi:MAG: VTT domain-containing protein, partial [Candidatus Saccharibacteria bacterium]|nr:VTT domain-containing protein [Moraxellaceae bacterium]